MEGELVDHSNRLPVFTTLQLGNHCLFDSVNDAAKRAAAMACIRANWPPPTMPMTGRCWFLN